MGRRRELRVGGPGRVSLPFRFPEEDELGWGGRAWARRVGKTSLLHERIRCSGGGGVGDAGREKSRAAPPQTRRSRRAETENKEARRFFALGGGVGAVVMFSDDKAALWLRARVPGGG